MSVPEVFIIKKYARSRMSAKKVRSWKFEVPEKYGRRETENVGCPMTDLGWKKDRRRKTEAKNR